jgi:hypothetical protein
MTENADLQAELQSLRAENAQLREHKPRGGWVRSTAVGILLILGTVLTVPGLAAPWLRTQILNTNRWVETMDAILSNPATISYVSTRINDQIYTQVDLEPRIEQALPNNLSFAAGAIASQVESKTQDLIDQALSSDQFREVWTNVITTAHSSIITFLENGQSDSLTVNSNNMLVLNLTPLVQQVQQRLIDNGMTFLSNVPVPPNIQVEIADASPLVHARQAVRLLQLVSWVFPILAIGCFIGAVALSRNRRRELVWAGIGLAIGALIVGVGLALGRAGFINAANDANIPITVSTSIFNDFVSKLRNAVRVTGLIGLLIALFAVLTGPSDGAVKLRRTVSGVITSSGEKAGFDSGPFGRWLALHRALTIAVIAGLCALLFVLADAPSPGYTLALVVVALLLFGAAMFLAAASAPKEELDDAEPTTGPAAT